MTDRPVNLDLGVSSQLDSQAQLHSQTQPESGQATPSLTGDQEQILQDAAKLQELLAGTRDSTAPAVVDAEQQAAPLPRPLDLIAGSLFKSPEPEPANMSSSTLVTELEENIARMARTLMVSQGPQGVTTVRMELGREQLPGVVLEVFRNEGMLVAQFVCANEQSHARLARAVSWLGESLSGRLKNDTLIRVKTDDPEDPLPVEVRNRATPV